MSLGNTRLTFDIQLWETSEIKEVTFHKEGTYLLQDGTRRFYAVVENPPTVIRGPVGLVVVGRVEDDE